MFNATAPSAPTTAKKFFLCVEDEHNDCFIIGRLIEKLCSDLDVRFVADGGEAVEWLSGKGAYADRNAYPLPDLLLTDLRMPRMDGFQLMGWVRSQPQFAQLPIVIHSDSIIPGVQNICRELGAHHYITKDASSRALGEFVRSYMSTHGLGMNDPSDAAQPSQARGVRFRERRS